MSKLSASSSKPPVIALGNIDPTMAGFENMVSFIEANGGRFSDYINPNVTHIVCSSVYFKEKGPYGESVFLGTLCRAHEMQCAKRSTGRTSRP